MNRKIIFGCLASIFGIFFFASLASADMIVNRPQQNNQSFRSVDGTSFSWAPGSPYIITASQSCGTTNICVGNYISSARSAYGVINTGTGFAFCNSVGTAGCPPIQNCLADNALNAKGPAATIKVVNTPQGTSYYAEPAR